MAHQHYKGTGKMHSFRGLLADGGQDKIRIQGPVGAIAWRITKFQIFPGDPGSEHYEATIKIYREFQTTVDNTVNLSDQNLLGAAYYQDDNAKHYASSDEVVFDNELFVRDIYVTYIGTDSAIADMNYYIELEEVKVSAAGMAQLAVAAARRREEL